VVGVEALAVVVIHRWIHDACFKELSWCLCIGS
jgi:hypothetical protein